MSFEIGIDIYGLAHAPALQAELGALLVLLGPTLGHGLAATDLAVRRAIRRTAALVHAGQEVIGLGPAIGATQLAFQGRRGISSALLLATIDCGRVGEMIAAQLTLFFGRWLKTGTTLQAGQYLLLASSLEILSALFGTIHNRIHQLR